MPPPEAARRHYDIQRRIAQAAAAAASTIWATFDTDNLDAAWVRNINRLYVAVSLAQQRSASSADTYIADVLDEQAIRSAAEAAVNPRAYAGVASDGRSLDSLLYQPIIATKVAIASGMDLPEAMATGQTTLLRIVATQVQDAGRAAVGAGIAARPRVGWVRMLRTPSCARCAVLAGKFFRWNEGFQRHPLCDCLHIPASESTAADLTTNPRRAIEAGEVTGLSESARQAIAEGADVGQVINARRGMRAGGTTTEGTTRRGFAGRRLASQGDAFAGQRSSRYRRTTTARLTPEAIYEQATDRAEALRLLKAHGYLV